MQNTPKDGNNTKKKKNEVNNVVENCVEASLVTDQTAKLTYTSSVPPITEEQLREVISRTDEIRYEDALAIVEKKRKEDELAELEWQRFHDEARDKIVAFAESLGVRIAVDIPPVQPVFKLQRIV